MSDSVGSAIHDEIARVQDRLIPLYQSIGPAGQPAIMMMKASLAAAREALKSGDVTAIIKAYADLKGYKE